MKDKPQMPLPGPVTRPRHPAGQIHEGAGTASSPVVGGAKIGQPGTRPSPPLPFALHELALGAPLAFTFPLECLSLRAEIDMPTTTDKSSPHGDWTPTSWQAKPAAQQPVYSDPDALHRVLGQLARLPSLITSWQIENPKLQLAEPARG